MKALFKLFLGGIGLLIVAVVAAVIIVATLDPNEHKDWLTGKAHEATGRELQLNGDIALTYYPWLGVEANDVIMGNAAGFGDAPFFKADHLKLRIKLMPLLKDEYEIDTVSIHGAEINLAKNAEGVSNWDDLVSGEEEQEKAAFPVAAIVLGGVDIKDARLGWKDASAETEYLLDKVNISTDALVFGEPIKLHMDMHALSVKPKIDSNFNLEGTIAYDIENHRYKITPLELDATLRSDNIPGGETSGSFSAGIDIDLDEDIATVSNLLLDILGTKLSGNLTAGSIQTSTPSVLADIKASGDDISRLFKVAEIEPLATQLAGLKKRSFSVETSFDADMERGDVDVSRLVLDMLGSNVNGEVKARNVLSEKPGYEGMLKAAGPDLPTLLQVIGQVQGGSKSPMAVYGKKLAKVKGKAFKIDLGFNADIKSGDVQVPTLSIDTLGISLAGNLNAKNMQSDSGSVSGKLDFNAAELGPLLKAIDQEAAAKSLHSLEFKTGIAGNANKVELKGLALKARVSGEQVGRNSLAVSMTANSSLNLVKKTLNMQELVLQGLGLDIKGNIFARDIMSAPALKGNIEVAEFNPRSLLKRLKQDIPKTSWNKALRRAAISTEFETSPASFKLDKLNLSLDQTRMTGSLGINNLEKPSYAFDLKVNSINLDHYMPPQPKGEAKKPVTPETAAGAVVQLPVDTLRALNAKGKLDIGKLVVSNAHLSKVKLNLDAAGGRIKMKPISANLYKGSYKGNIDINATEKLPKLVIDSSIKGVQIEPLLKDVTGEAMLVGTSDISIATVARGNNTDMFKKTLAGQAELKVTRGIVRGVDIDSALEQVEVMIESKRFGKKINTEGDTPFNSLTATLPINKGIVNNKDLRLIAPKFSVSGKGMVANLRNMTWKYDLSVKVPERSITRNNKTYNVGGYNIPLKCRKKISGDNCSVDPNFAITTLKKIFLDDLLKPDVGEAAGKAIDPGKQLLDKALENIFK